MSEPIEGLETLGCADRNCPFTKHLGGMRTNGGCKCLFEAVRDVQDRRDIQRLIQWKDDEITRLLDENERLKAARLKPETAFELRALLMAIPTDDYEAEFDDFFRCYPPEEE